MTTLADMALTVATQLGRVNAAADQITDLANEIKAEIRNSVRFYNRKPMHLTEVRGGTLTTAEGQTWYSTVEVATSAGDQGLSGRDPVNVNDIINIHYMRENPGAAGLNEAMSEVPYMHFERLFEGNFPTGQPEYFTMYAGQIGIWPSPSGENTLYWSGTVKPVVPSVDASESVWFDQANELIEAAAASRVCAKYLRDTQRAQVFAAQEQQAYQVMLHEYTSKASTGRLRAHE